MRTFGYFRPAAGGLGAPSQKKKRAPDRHRELVFLKFAPQPVSAETMTAAVTMAAGGPTRHGTVTERAVGMTYSFLFPSGHHRPCHRFIGARSSKFPFFQEIARKNTWDRLSFSTGIVLYICPSTSTSALTNQNPILPLSAKRLALLAALSRFRASSRSALEVSFPR